MKCNLCPRQCNKDRDFELGFCKASNKVKIAKYSLFQFEEPCISGKGGSGAIFFSHCSLGCVFCQNYDISSLGNGKEITIKQLAEIFKKLESMGADNINLVTPTQYVLQIIEALKIYRPKIPIIYNTHGYECENTIRLLANYVDVFLPDFKFYRNESALKYSNANNYVDVVKKSILLMRKLKPDIYENGMIKQGLIVRHMIMPLLSDESVNILTWLKENVADCKVSLMAQYVPYGKASLFKEINRRITKREYDKVVSKYLDLNLDGYIQDRESADTLYIPKWDY